MKICSQCGNQNEDNLNFCTECGASLIEAQAQPEVQVQPEVQPQYQQTQNQQTGYQQNSYQQTGYQQPLNPTPGAKNKAVAALVLGIVGIVTYWIMWFNIISLVISIVGIVLAVKARNEIPDGYAGKGMATAGLVLSIIGTVLSGIGFLTCTLCVTCAACGSAYSYY